MKKGMFFYDIVRVFVMELQRMFADMGVILVFFVAGLTYPLLFNLVYRNETVSNLPIAVVDDSHGEGSRRFVHKLDATPELNVDYSCNSLDEARRLMERRQVNGIIYFPADYDDCLAQMRTARVCVFADMSSFLYYKSVVMGSSYAMLDEMKQIQVERYEMAGVAGEMNDVLVNPLGYNDVKLYGAGSGGFTSFLLPALLILVIHQTLFFGIGMLGGGAQEDRSEINLMPASLRGRRRYRVVLGRALAYLATYLPLVAIDLLLLPRLFGLPHIGHTLDLVLFLIPFMLATVFFGMTASVLVRERETGILTMVFFSIVLLFLSGFAWPMENMPVTWRLFSWLFPSTHGVQGYIRINSLGARLPQVSFEYGALWIQTGAYFLTACAALAYIDKARPARRRAARQEVRMRQEARTLHQRILIERAAAKQEEHKP